MFEFVDQPLTHIVELNITQKDGAKLLGTAEGCVNIVQVNFVYWSVPFIQYKLSQAFTKCILQIQTNDTHVQSVETQDSVNVFTFQSWNTAILSFTELERK